MTMKRQFFDSNTITPFKTFSAQFFEDKRSSFKSGAKTKRVTSYTSAKLNPEKFIRRQSFNSKLYSQKPFSIAAQFKQQNEKLKKIFSFDENQHFLSLKNSFNKPNSQDFGAAVDNLTHYFKVIHQQLSEYKSENLNAIKSEVKSLKQGMQRIFKIFCKESEYKQSKYLSNLFSQKAKHDRSDSSKLNQMQNASKRAQTSILLQKNRLKLSAESIDCKPLYEAKLKKLTEKVNVLEFQNKKQILLIESINQQKKKKEAQVASLEHKISEMGQKIGKVKQIEDFFNYKIKKLQEELEVAHIVKEQNLAEKMKYIMSGSLQF